MGDAVFTSSSDWDEGLLDLRGKEHPSPWTLFFPWR